MQVLRWMKKMMNMSRRWRDLILHSSSLWFTIKVSPTQRKSLVGTHVAHSCQYPLDIEICSWFKTASRGRQVALLVIATPSAPRWCSLAIQGDVGRLHAPLRSEVFVCITFSALASVSMLNVPQCLEDIPGGYIPNFLHQKFSSSQTSGP